jgi:UDP-N-acetylglucosamine 2-epimerase (non-hydrolysing)
MPEEVNRVLTDQLADLLLTPSPDARDNLLLEGIAAEKISFAGNVMVDTMFHQLERARALQMSSRLGIKGDYAVVTLHRPSNVDSALTLQPIVEGLAQIARELPVVFPIHPRTRRSAEQAGLLQGLDGAHLLEPLGYVEMLSLTAGARVVITDSGGLQEETTALAVPCVTLREQTERPITVTEGTNRLAPWPLSAAGIFSAYRDATSEDYATARAPVQGWDGQAAERIVQALHAAGPTGD